MSQQDSSISLREKICYGLGDLSGNLCYVFISSYLLYYYTDVAHLAVGAVGGFMAMVRLIDSIANPVIGMALDRTNTRFGKIRPFLLFTNLPLALLLVALFSSPHVGETGKLIYAAITFLLYSLTYSANNTPYSALSTNMTDREDERLQLGKYRTIGMSIGSFAITLGALPLIAFFGKGNEQMGFFKTVLIYAALSFVSMHLCFRYTKERINPPAEKARLPLWISLKYAFQSKPWVLFCLLQSIAMASFTIRSENTIYYCKYILQNKGVASVLLTTSSITTLVIAFFLPKMAEHFGKRRVLIAGYLLELLSLVGIALVGQHTAGVVVFHIIACFGTSAATGLFFIMISETIDHSEWQCGVRQQGLLSALLMLAVKLFCMLASFLGAHILSWSGYAEGVVPDEKVLFAFRANFLYIPMLLAVLFIIGCLFYRLEDSYPTILKELRERRRENES